MTKQDHNEIKWLKHIIEWYDSLPKPLDEIQTKRYKEFTDRFNKFTK